MRIHSVVSALLLLLVAAAAHASASPSALQDRAAPDFALKSLAGSNLRLSELRGEVVLLNFWATWCGPCRQEMPELNQIYKEYHNVGLEVLGVNIDDVADSASQMTRSLNVTFPVLFDESKAVSRLYRVDTMPITFIVGRDGTVRYVHKGYEPGYEQTYMNEVRTLLKE
jgi:peroxiredoxin